MTDIVPGTDALVVMRVGTRRGRPDWGLPVPFAEFDQQPNHVLFVTAAAKDAGRNAYANLVGSTLTVMGRPFAMVEFASSLGSASRAHKAQGVPVDLVSPLDHDWPYRLADRIDAHFERIVVVSVPADLWIAFARIEAALLRSFDGARPVAFAFVDPSGEAGRLQAHLNWLAQHRLPAFEHRLVLRGAPPYSVSKLPTPGYFNHTVMPDFAPQVADAIFTRAKPVGQPLEHATFHAAFAGATNGTKGMMFEGVAAAMRDIAIVFEAARRQSQQEAG